MKKKDLIHRVNEAIEKIRPFLLADGGDIELIDINDNVVTIKFIGACSECSINQSTLKLGVETTIKNQVPEIIEVISII